ncbi:MAG: ATP-binding protein [Cyclobacteriaceae bacterium]|nr:ATP-binding protein [Cyclobacteriaceae bacterium]
MIIRTHYSLLANRLQESERPLIQVLYGPRQVGKTTMALQLKERLKIPCHYVSADNVHPDGQLWIEQQWTNLRVILKSSGAPAALLIIDEVQKVANWSEQVKKEWDTDTRDKINIKVVLSGSSRLLLQQGLTESLAGRYERIYLSHWSYTEMHEAFGVTPDEYVWYGGYPGSAMLYKDEDRWKDYIKNSIVEPSISKDVLMLTRIDKPALLKRLFEMGCIYSSQILSFNKILGQLLDAGNTVTLSHYLELLNQAGLLAGIEKYSPDMIRQRASSPKFQVHNMALLTAMQPYMMREVANQTDKWGRWVESAVGSHLLNHALQEGYSLYYWRHRNDEIDFVMDNKKSVAAIEVKGGYTTRARGMAAFQKKYRPDKTYLIGRNGMPWQEFLKINPAELF